jgi:hypothetical protein
MLDWLKQSDREPGGMHEYYKDLGQQAEASDTERLEPLSTIAKRLGLLR